MIASTNPFIIVSQKNFPAKHNVKKLSKIEVLTHQLKRY